MNAKLAILEMLESDADTLATAWKGE